MVQERQRPQHYGQVVRQIGLVSLTDIRATFVEERLGEYAELSQWRYKGDEDGAGADSTILSMRMLQA